GCGGRCEAPATRPQRPRSRSAPRAPARAGRRPSPRRRALRRRCGARRLCRLLETREVEARDRLGDELPVALGVERLADDARGGLEREVGDLGPDLGEGTARLGRDLLLRLLEPALALGLGFVLHALLHRLAGLARLGEDRLRLATRLTDELLVLLEEL